jgi:NADH-quinone oxidoreductase subunit I
MGYLFDSLRSLGVTMRGAFRKPTTVHYPMEKRERAERYRNTFALLHDEAGDEACVGCLQCEKICPSEIISIDAEKKESPITGKRRGYAKDFVLDLNACIFCELCVQVCPTDAIVMCRVPEQPGFTREDLCLTMDRLYANEKAKPATWGTATRLMEMQDPKRGEPKPEPKAKKAAAKPEAAPGEPNVVAAPDAAQADAKKPAEPTKTAVAAKMPAVPAPPRPAQKTTAPAHKKADEPA